MKTTALSLITLALVVLVNPAMADDAKELRKQRQAAQKERQAEKNERARRINEATRSFQTFSRELKTEYQTMLRDLDTEFELAQVEIRAARDAEIAAVEADYQQKLMSLFTAPGASGTTPQQLEQDHKAYADETFELRKRFAAESHQERIANERRKHELLAERDQRALDEAAALGLTEDYSPILATAIGDGLTQQEESWNTRQEKEVARLKERNLRTVAEFANGEKLRAWELGNLEQDFQLQWREKAELHAVNSETLLHNTMLMQATQGGEVDQQEIMARMTELNKKNQQIKIEYKKIRDQNRIKRREEKRKLQGR
ncbi:MAG: hypothetical protein OET44_06310 [Gammaproteobacteria bacterium]|nr:hypothetical protein [Gammaproteobacteria bacterium]